MAKVYTVENDISEAELARLGRGAAQALCAEWTANAAAREARVREKTFEERLSELEARVGALDGQ